MNSLDPQLRDFILFCVDRNGNEWPSLYSEMVNVSNQRIFRGLGYSELQKMGLSLALSRIDELRQQIKQAMYCEK
jgi:hypothetical protein